MSLYLLTVFQRLGKLFGPQGPRTTQSTFNQYKFSKKDLLKTTDKAEFDAAKLQAQQTAFLAKQWEKVDNELYTQSIYY